MKKNIPVLESVDLEMDWELAIPPEVEEILSIADCRLQDYWDQWHKRPIEQYVACDFRDVWRALVSVTEQKH